MSLLDDLYDPVNRVMRDVVIDDGDFKEAPNFWSFTHDKRWLGANFFSRQLYPLSRLFMEICPKCSNPKYKHILDVPIDVKAADFPEHFQLLEYGTCPKCKSTKLDLLREGLINPYQEMAGLAGQRVGKSMITAGGANYLTHKMLKLQRPAEAYGGLLNPLLVGTFVGLTYDAAAEQLWMPYRTFMETSPWYCIAEDANITMANGSTEKIQNITVGACVKTFEGASVVTEVFDNGVKDVWELELEDGTTLQATEDHKIRCWCDGEVIWKKLADLGEGDLIVSE